MQKQKDILGIQLIILNITHEAVLWSRFSLQECYFGEQNQHMWG